MSLATAQKDMLHGLPGIYRHSIPTPAVGGTDATADVAVTQAPFRCSLHAAYFTPLTAVTGAATNYRNLNVKDAGGTEAASIDFANGTNAGAKTATALTLSGTTANKQFEDGEVIVIESEKVGTGIALPAGVITLELKAR